MFGLSNIFSCCGDARHRKDASDFQRLEHACANKDANTLAELLPSHDAIPMQIRQKPPSQWVENPIAVGSLAGCELAILVDADHALADKMRESIKELIRFVRSEEKDRAQVGLVLLMLLSSVRKNCLVMYKNKCMEPLVLQLREGGIANRLFACRACCNVIMTKPDSLFEFAQLGGVEAIVQLLEIDVSDEFCYEVMMNLRNVLIVDGEPQDCCTQALKAGAKPILERLTTHSDRDLQKGASELLGVLMAWNRTHENLISFLMCEQKQKVDIS